MFGDTVLDPFLGTGRTSLAAAISGRNSIGIEIDESLSDVIHGRLNGVVEVGRTRVERRLMAHEAFVLESEDAKRSLHHTNRHYGFPVMTKQEEDLTLFRPERVTGSGNCRDVEHVVAEVPIRERQLEFDFEEGCDDSLTSDDDEPENTGEDAAN